MRKAARGFTLVELLVVIAIIAILAVIVGVVINPIELRKRSNDATRLSDMASLQQAINVAVQEATVSGGDILCKDTDATTPPCSGDSDDLNARNNNGTGWVKVDLSGQKAVSVPRLPLDPINDSAHLYYYSTNTDGDAWEINAVLESKQYKDVDKKMENDGGSDPNRYEVGSSLDIMNP